MENERTEQNDTQFILDLTAVNNHPAWLAVVRFGLATLLDNQALLTQLIAREATRQVQEMINAKSEDEIPEAHVFAQRMMEELGLQLTLA